MKNLALIHTVRPGYLRFGEEIAKALPEVRITNTLDEYLAKEATEKGASPHLRERFYYAAKLAESTGADLIVCACTSLIPVFDAVKQFINTPMILIDDEMMRCAPSMGNHVAIFATVDSALQATKAKYLAYVKTQASGEKQITDVLCTQAQALMVQGDTEGYAKLVLAAARKIPNVDLVILAQYSLSTLKEEIEERCGCKVLASGDFCIREIAHLLDLPLRGNQ